MKNLWMITFAFWIIGSPAFGQMKESEMMRGAKLDKLKTAEARAQFSRKEAKVAMKEYCSARTVVVKLERPN
jgi:hypothetical protein